MDAAPVGREFGSPDFERLMRQDAESMKATLAELVATCSADPTVLPEATQYWQDTRHVQKALKELGHDVDLDTAARVWKDHSRSLMASWMSGAQTVRSAGTAILNDCAMTAPRI